MTDFGFRLARSPRTGTLGRAIAGLAVLALSVELTSAGCSRNTHLVGEQPDGAASGGTTGAGGTGTGGATGVGGATGAGGSGSGGTGSGGTGSGGTGSGGTGSGGSGGVVAFDAATDRLVDGSAPPCPGVTCSPGDVCVRHQTIGSPCLNNDAAFCQPRYACAPLPAACAGTLTCTCAYAAFCTNPDFCATPTATEIDCSFPAP